MYFKVIIGESEYAMYFKVIIGEKNRVNFEDISVICSKDNYNNNKFPLHKTWKMKMGKYATKFHELTVVMHLLNFSEKTTCGEMGRSLFT